ncbi:MAG: hypothetical protein IJY35_10980, partial [Clostridia bacterium]|nr:hypothetical protein [Clostridia bacterium]
MKKLRKTFIQTRFWLLTGCELIGFGQLRGIFLDGVQFEVFDSGLRMQLRIAAEGAMPSDAYRII